MEEKPKHLIEGTVEHEEYMTLAYKYSWITPEQPVRDFFIRIFKKVFKGGKHGQE